MKIFYLLACAFTLYITSGCDSISVRENILEKEKVSVNRISTSEISSGYALINARYLGSEAGYNHILIYEIKYLDAIIFLKIQKETSVLYFSVGDMTVKTKIDNEYKELKIYFGRKIGDSFMLGDISGPTPLIYIQLDDLNEAINNSNSYALKRYNSFSGKVCYIYNGRLDEAGISTKLSVET